MTKIVVFRNGTKIIEQELDPGREYVIGRSNSCDLCLDAQEVSRQHAKLSYNGKDWVCEITSRFGRLVSNGAQVDSIHLIPGSSFLIPPFELRLDQPREDSLRKKQTTSRTNTPIPEEKPVRPAPSSVASGEGMQEFSFNAGTQPPSSPEDPLERTSTGAVAIKSVLFRLNSQKQPVEEITLGEGLIEAGRSRDCQIVINDPKASRRHFTLQFNGLGFILKDLETPNKTLVNGKPITTHNLQAGDVITVGKERFRYDEVNPAFENLPSVVDNTEPAVIKVMPHGGNPYDNYRRTKGARKSNPLMLVIIGIIGIGALLKLSSSDPEGGSTTSRNPDSTVEAPASAFDRLSPEQKKFVDETYNLALNLYQTGRYELAALEINKILQLMPDFKESRKILALTQEAIDRNQKRELVARRQREEQEVKSKVDDILDECEKLITRRQYDQVDACVAQTADLDPENDRAQSLVAQAQESLMQTKMLQENKAESNRRRSQAYQYFNSAKKAFQDKRYPAAISDFNKVASMSFNDKEGIKEKAKIGIRSAKDKLNEQGQSLFAAGKAALDSKDYKGAITNLSKALAIAPDNGDIRSYKERAEKELRQEMKNLYAESVIEENLGNIESAKKKWRTIIEVDVKTDDYFTKAKSKLDKYEK